MKKTLLALIAAVCMSFVGSSAYATIVGSAHDLSDDFAATDEICIFCHTPHNGQDTPLLWNRTVNAASDYTVYTNSDSLNATGLSPGSVSLKCLSCHDGTIQVDAYGLNTSKANSGTTYIGAGFGASRELGQDLTDDHPIGFTYDGALATDDGELTTPDSGTVSKDGSISVPLFSGNMECATCHDVHNSEITGVTYLLRGTMTGSALCLNCHTK